MVGQACLDAVVETRCANSLCILAYIFTTATASTQKDRLYAHTRLRGARFTDSVARSAPTRLKMRPCSAIDQQKTTVTISGKKTRQGVIDNLDRVIIFALRFSLRTLRGLFSTGENGIIKCAISPAAHPARLANLRRLAAVCAHTLTHTHRKGPSRFAESQWGLGVPVVRFVDECSAIIQLHDTTAATDPGDQHTSVVSFEARLTLNPATNVLKSRGEKDGILLMVVDSLIRGKLG